MALEQFVDPADTRILPQDIEADIIAIRRQNTFQVIAAGFLGPETAVPFYDGRSHLSYIWVGTRRIGQEIKTDGLTCPARKGVNFLASLKYDPKNASLKVLLSYVDFFDPEMRYVPIQVTLNRNDIIWEGHTDPRGRRNREIYNSVAVNPESIPGKLEIQLNVDDNPVGSPQNISVDEHMLFSKYSNSPVSSGRSKFGESRFVLFSSLNAEEIERSNSVSLIQKPCELGRFRLYDILWDPHKGPFKLGTGDTEWSFQQSQDIYFVSELEYNDSTFEIDPELTPYATNHLESISFRLHANIPKQPTRGV